MRGWEENKKREEKSKEDMEVIDEVSL